MSLTYAYWPGCVGQSMCRELDLTTKLVCAKLGIELRELTEATCTGARDLHQTPYGELRINKDTPDLEILFNARTFSMAEGWGLDVMTVCNTCTTTMRSVNIRLKENPKLLENTNRVLREVSGREYRGSIDVKHFLNVVVQDYGLENLQAKVVKPLGGMPIAPFYGCHSIRPPKYAFDDPENPHLLEDLIKALGGTPVEYRHKLSCCGFHVKLAEDETATRVAGQAIATAKDAGAVGMVSPCPLCHMALDLWQSDAEKMMRRELEIPQLHAPQLVGLALGIDPKAMRMDKHAVPTSTIVQLKRKK